MKKHFLYLTILSAFSGYAFTPDTKELNRSSETYQNNINLKGKEDSDEGINGKIRVTGNVGFNATRVSLLVRYNIDTSGTLSTPIITSSSQIPLLNLGVDYGFAKRFSVGAAFGYQSIKLNANAIKNGIAGTDTWTRIHLAVRGDYYIVATENVNLYTGLKIGYNTYSVKSTYTSINPNYINQTISLTGKPLAAGVQAHIGFSYYFNGLVGFNTEAGLAVGGPYYLALGIGAKF